MEPETYNKSKVIRARLEEARRRNKASHRISAWYRGRKQYKSYMSWRRNVIMVQSVVRRHRACKAKIDLAEREYQALCALFRKGSEMFKYYGPSGQYCMDNAPAFLLLPHA